MDGNCNITTEILLVTLLVTAKSNNITVSSYCPTLAAMYETNQKPEERL